MHNHLVSIVIPVYNREDFIAECIESALRQDYPNIEVIVIDNASTDSTWAVAKRFEEQDSRVRCVRNTGNIGPVANWKEGLRHARGEFCKILFSDDLLHSSCISRTLPRLLDDDCAFIYSSVLVGSTPRSSVLEYSQVKLRQLAAIDYIGKALVTNYLPVSPCAALFRTHDLLEAIVDDIPSPSISDFAQTGAGPDLLAFLLVARKYAHVGYVDAPLVFFRSHGGSISVSGKGPFILKRYAQARVWFAAEYVSSSVVDQILAIQALLISLYSRKVVTPKELSAQLLESPRKVPVFTCVVAAAGFCFQEARRIVSRKLRLLAMAKRGHLQW